MAIRDDITVAWHLSPRLITVAAPSTEVTVQDLHDTLRDLEDEPANLIYPSIISTAGKEDLGGGVSVGLTATLLNAQIAFEARTTNFELGTATDGTDQLLEDFNTGTDFITSGVLRGDVVQNTTDGSQASVVSIINENQLVLTPLTGGTLDVFNFGDEYQIWHVIQCNLDGGNIVAVDNDDAELSPVFPTAFTQVIRTSSSSATLQELEDIQFSSFMGAVWVDANVGSSGTEYPFGTPRQPVNNIADAVTIANTRGFTTIRIIGDYTFESGDNVSLFEIIGQSRAASTLTFNAGSIVAGAEFRSCTLTGVLASPAAFEDVLINDITGATIGLVGIITVRNCEFSGIVTLSATLEGEIHLIDCSSARSASAPVFNMNGADVDALIRNYSGDMEIRNFSNVSNNNMSIDMNSGNVIIDSTCTTGTIIIRGIALISDSSTGSTVLTSGLVFPNAIQQGSFERFVFLNVTGGSTGTKYPLGTHSNPVNNLADAQAIAINRGLSNILLEGTLIVGPFDNLDDFLIKGITASESVVILVSGCSTDNTQFEDLTLTGAVDGNVIVRRCGIQNLTNLGSTITGTTIAGCAILDSVTPALQVKPGLVSSKALHILNCSSFNNTGDGPVIDVNGSTTPLIVIAWDGYAELQNYSGGQSSAVTINTGTFVLDSSCTSGTIRFSGTGTLEDNSSIGLTVIDELLNHDNETINGVVADLVAAAGSTASVVRTDATQADNFYDGMMLAVVNSAGTIARTIESYSNTDGAFTLTNDLPFVPSNGDQVIVLASSELISQIFVNSILIPAAI